ncbi:hypothetical protein SSX86_029822 [Deinandra increscens subsp. villosa]|uniref:RRM domain-containing protein n=1 Tax=Deinandra increscens subsp. villosa TaxID=3103831 RepID=A0AAP0GMS2_9ASTR
MYGRGRVAAEAVNVDEGWKTVRRRKDGVKESEREESFYVADLPNGCSGRFLWEAFKKMGNISDAFVPGRRDWRGRQFGFVRFKGVRDVEEMLQKLRGVTVDGAKMRVFISKFKREQWMPKQHRQFDERVAQSSSRTRWEREANGNVWYERTKRQNWAEVVKGNDVNQGVGRNVLEDRKGKGIVLEKHDGLEKHTGKKSEVRREDTEGSRKQVRIESNPGLWQRHCEGRSLIGEIRYLEVLEDMRERMAFMGHENVAMSYLGGMKVILTFKEGQVARNFMIKQKEGWGRCFSSLRWWNGAEQENERIVQLRIMGVPVMIRDDTTFDKIGEKFGRRVSSSDFSWALDDNSVGRVCIATKELRWIDELVDIEWNNMWFTVWVREDTERWKIPVLNDPPKKEKLEAIMEEARIRSEFRRKPVLQRNNVDCGRSSAGQPAEVRPVMGRDGHGEDGIPRVVLDSGEKTAREEESPCTRIDDVEKLKGSDMDTRVSETQLSSKKDVGSKRCGVEVEEVTEGNVGSRRVAAGQLGCEGLIEDGPGVKNGVDNGPINLERMDYEGGADKGNEENGAWVNSQKMTEQLHVASEDVRKDVENSEQGLREEGSGSSRENPATIQVEPMEEGDMESEGAVSGVGRANSVRVTHDGVFVREGLDLGDSQEDEDTWDDGGGDVTASAA